MIILAVAVVFSIVPAVKSTLSTWPVHPFMRVSRWSWRVVRVAVEYSLSGALRQEFWRYCHCEPRMGDTCAGAHTCPHLPWCYTELTL